MKDDDLVCFETDKTGKFALDKKENYIKKMRKHIKDDDIVSMTEVKKIEKELNEHAEHLVKITNVGIHTNQVKRIKGNLKTSDNQIPILSGTHKDHKKVDDLNIGPDVRPIMGATVGPNVALTDFIARNIIRKVAEDASDGNDCKSSEELLNKFEEYNHRRIQNGYSSRNVIIASMDIDKWFPTMKIRPMTKEVKQMIVDSEIEFKEIDYENASKYLGEKMTIEEILEEKMEDILYIEAEKMRRLEKAKYSVTNDVTSARGNDEANKAHKDCAEGRRVAHDVTPVNDENKKVEAHKDCAKEIKVTNDVTLACNDEKENEAHKECVENETVTNDVTSTSRDDKVNKAHKDCAEGKRVAYDVTPVNNDSKKVEANKDCAADFKVTNDVNPACDDEKENKAHKECVIIPPKRNPNEVEKRNMIGKMVEIMAVLGMENHVYRFENIIRKQRSGGPIGLSLTGDIADCYLIGWDKKFIKKLKALGIDLILYERFKDDITIIADSIERGSKYENGTIVVDMEKKKSDEDRSDGEVTMEIIVDIAESIDGIIKFTYDIPEKHTSGKLPILDVEVNINKKEENRVDFQFFEKPTKNKRVILENSALPANQKRTILTQEYLRRILNTKMELGEEVRRGHLNNFMLKLKNSGYGRKFRTEVLDSALSAYDKIRREDEAGTKPMYRSRDWNREERDKKKSERKFNWYNVGNKEIGYKSVLFVPITKGGKLLKVMKQREEEINKYSDERIKIVEGGGVQMKNLLVVKDPFPTQACEMRKCILCKANTKEIKFACNTNNVGYRLVCETCEEKGLKRTYEGETARSARTRGAEHMRDFKKGKDDSAMHKHKQNEHNGDEIKYRMEITKSFRDPLTRQANEAVRISSMKKNENLNSKNEFNHPPIARITVERSRKFKNKNACGTAQPSL